MEKDEVLVKVGDPIGFKVRSDYLPFSRPAIGEEEINQVIDTLKSGWLTMGRKTKEFEEKFGEFTGARHAMSVNSCTSGLFLSLLALGIGPGDEVITTPFTFVSTANVITHTGAKPVFVDIVPSTLNIDPVGIEAAITERTKAIIPVHFAGAPCDMREINRIAGKYGLFIVEDAAHALGAEYDGEKIGCGGNVVCFSFYPNKNITTGEGGMITTGDDELASKIEVMRYMGMDRNAWSRYGKNGSSNYAIHMNGYKCYMSDLNAGIGLAQLSKLKRLNEERTRIAEYYRRELLSIPEIDLIEILDGARSSWHLFPILVNGERSIVSRETIISRLKELNIGVAINFQSLHVQPYYMETFGYRRGDFPVSETASANEISLPLFPGMSMEDADYVVGALKHALSYR